jgi:hypothetical protein
MLSTIHSAFHPQFCNIDAFTKARNRYGFFVKAGPAYELVASNHLDAPSLATPAISEGRLFVRTKDHILAFGAAAVP